MGSGGHRRGERQHGQFRRQQSLAGRPELRTGRVALPERLRLVEAALWARKRSSRAETAAWSEAGCRTACGLRVW